MLGYGTGYLDNLANHALAVRLGLVAVGCRLAMWGRQLLYHLNELGGRVSIDVTQSIFAEVLVRSPKRIQALFDCNGEQYL